MKRVLALNPRVINADYAVRGRVVSAAWKLQQQDPTKKIIYCNIGNPHSFLQKPLSFPRRVLSLSNNPELIKLVNYPDDVILRAKKYLNRIPGGTGAYSHSQGVEVVREEVCRFIQERDLTKQAPDVSNIFLTDGASPAVQRILQLLIRNEKDGIMIPTPQYPLYSASIGLAGGTGVPYFLTEEKRWSLDRMILEESLKSAKNKGIEVRALVVINPGNPTGQTFTRQVSEAVVEFCLEHDLVLLADEVYQENDYIPGREPFESFRKVVHECNVQDRIRLASIHSVSKGFFGECGRRGGYADVLNFDKEMKAQFYKLASVNLCSNLDGQIMLGCMVNPPKPGDASYEEYSKEREEILSSLARRAKKVGEKLNSIPNMSCQPIAGALYAFPRIYLPERAIELAKSRDIPADEFFCLELLEATGIVVVPGSGFGQKPGEWHFRTTILPIESEIDSVLAGIDTFHRQFWKKYE